MAHSETSPSSTKLDAPSAPPGHPTGPPSADREPLAGRTKPAKPSPETIVPDSQPSNSLSVRTKAREQSFKTVLSREFPKGNSLKGIKPSSRISSAPIATMHTAIQAPTKPPDRKDKMGDVSRKKQMSAAEHSPAPKAALTLPKYTPISCIQAPPAPSYKDRAPLSSQVFPLQRTCNAIRMHQVASDMAHLETKTPSRVSRKPASLQSGEILSPAVPGQPGVSSVSDMTPELSSRSSPSWSAASTLLNSMPVHPTRGLPSLKPGDFKKPSVKKTDVTSTAGMSAGANSPASDTVHPMRNFTPASPSTRTSHVNTTDDVKTCQEVSRTARQGVEVLTKLETTKPWSGMTLSANGIEHSDERSNAIIGPAVEQALAFVSAEVGESHVTHCKIETRQRVSDSSTLPRTVSSRHEQNVKTHREAEAFTRASSRAVSLRFDKNTSRRCLRTLRKAFCRCCQACY
ncbi:hypothetical protein AX14_006502 [Amanita brunnescens Koide BX004]|nr:hypothetical protein AX14_006502 [Amanita brunnescens Koide BX004]